MREVGSASRDIVPHCWKIILLKFVVRMFSGSPDKRMSGTIARKCIKIALSVFRSIQFYIFKHIAFSARRTL